MRGPFAGRHEVALSKSGRSSRARRTSGCGRPRKKEGQISLREAQIRRFGPAARQEQRRRRTVEARTIICKTCTASQLCARNARVCASAGRCRRRQSRRWPSTLRLQRKPSKISGDDEDGDVARAARAAQRERRARRRPPPAEAAKSQRSGTLCSRRLPLRVLRAGRSHTLTLETLFNWSNLSSLSPSLSLSLVCERVALRTVRVYLLLYILLPTTVTGSISH